MKRADILLYGILDPARSAGRALPELAAEAARAGVTLLQYRDKQSSGRHLVETALQVKLNPRGGRWFHVQPLLCTGVRLILRPPGRCLPSPLPFGWHGCDAAAPPS